MPLMSEVRCERTDLYVSQCGHCLGIVGRSPQEHYEVSVVIPSKFAGRCQGCGTRYDEGSMIGHSNEADGWVLMECCGSVRH